MGKELKTIEQKKAVLGKALLLTVLTFFFGVGLFIAIVLLVAKFAPK